MRIGSGHASRAVAGLALLVAVATACGGSSVTARVQRTAPGSSVAPTPLGGSAPVISPPPSAAPAPAVAAIGVRPLRAPWTEAIHDAIGDADVSVAVGLGHRIVVLVDPRTPRVLASTTKLLTSMAALDTWGPRHRFLTYARSRAEPVGGTLRGDLWLVGSGDPELGDARLADLARAIREAGVRRIEGSVRGDTAAFDRGWWAPGWLPGVSRRYVRRTTALAYEGNVAASPEAAAATSLTGALEGLGISVAGAPGAAPAPPRLTELAAVRSDPLAELLARQNRDSLNFHAETLAKAVGATTGSPSTAGGAAVTRRWSSARGIDVSVRDGSGLSYQDRATAPGLVGLLLLARDESWFAPFLASLATAGAGTLEGRLSGVEVHAKTGTLIERPVSALAGYVRTRDGQLAAFAILSDGSGKDSAIRVEDAVVRALAGAVVGAAA
jgi:D-alanyl-D-alanine carboxypeptidase/D-alanyl-D-alanine-endopeptidase (penicillin-binding protein 4)